MKMLRFALFAVSALLHATLVGKPSSIGHWVEDGVGLPAFKFTAALPVQTRDGAGQPFKMRQDPIFLLGNYRLSLFVHASGIWQLMSGERAWARFNAAGNSYGANRSVLRVHSASGEQTYALVGVDSLAADPTVCRRVFGTGFAEFDYTLPGGLKVTRTLSVAPSQAVNVGLPGFIVSVTLRNGSPQAIDVTHEEAVLANYEPVLDRLIPRAYRHVQYLHKALVNPAEFSARCDLVPESADPTALRRRNEVSRFDAFPPSLFLQSLAHKGGSEHPEAFAEADVSGGQVIGARVSTALAAGEERTLHWLVSLVPQSEETLIDMLRAAADTTKPPPYFRDQWKARLPNLSDERDPIWRREMTWHAYVLEAMATYNEFYGETYIPQGQTYDYEMDLTAAPRDHLQHALAASYTNPALAKSCLRFVLKKMTAQGEIPYTSNGFGRTSNLAWTTSDQQLYLFYVVGEYLRITRDYAFLGENIESPASGSPPPATTLEKLRLALMYLRDEVKVGSHGLVRLMNSDWSDMVYADTSVFRYFWTAESHMNSAMVVAVFPTLIEQLDMAQKTDRAAFDHSGAEQVRKGLNRYLQGMRGAVYRDLGDASFSRRLYLDGTQAWGHDTMHIEPQSFLMLAPDFPRERKLRLWSEVKTRILNDEPLGPRQRQDPFRNSMFEPGQGENGGVWYALAGPMILGVATVDRDAAWALLRRMSMDTYAKTFPDYWAGQWTAPECFNSVVAGPLVGLPRTEVGGMFTSFPAYCAHAHAWPLYCYYRLKEIAAR